MKAEDGKCVIRIGVSTCIRMTLCMPNVIWECWRKLHFEEYVEHVSGRHMTTWTLVGTHTCVNHWYPTCRYFVWTAGGGANPHHCAFVQEGNRANSQLANTKFMETCFVLWVINNNKFSQMWRTPQWYLHYVYREWKQTCWTRKDGTMNWSTIR